MKTENVNQSENNSICFFPKTKQHLEKEIEILKQARDGIGRAWNVLRQKGIEDEHLRKLYNEFDIELKDYQQSVEALCEHSLQFCVAK